MQGKSFRQWLQDKWYEHLDELESWNLTVNYSLPQYFNRYRWWLKREYRHYQKLTPKY
jgi:hypothetical protein